MKKVVSLLLVLVMALGMSTVAFSAEKINGMKAIPGWSVDKGSDHRAGDTYPVAIFDSGNLNDLFTTTNGAPITKQMLEKVSIDFRTKAGGAIIDKIEWKDIKTAPGTSIVNYATMQATFIDPFVSLSDSDFEQLIYFTVDGKRSDQKWDFYLEFTGTLSNQKTDLENDENYVDCSDGQIANAKQYLKGIEVDLGNGVKAVINMANKKKIYARAYTDGDLKDEPIFDKYKSIEIAYTIRQIGLSSYSGNFVTLSDVDASAYIYGKDNEGNLKYLGRGGDKLPYSDKYYVSNAKIDIETTDEVPDEVPTPGTPNANANPGTGR